MKPLLFQHLSSLVLILIWIYQTLGTGHWFLTACFTAVFVILFLWKQFFFLIKNDESILHENQLKLLQESLNRLLHFNEAKAEDLCFHSLVGFFFQFLQFVSFLCCCFLAEWSECSSSRLQVVCSSETRIKSTRPSAWPSSCTTRAPMRRKPRSTWCLMWTTLKRPTASPSPTPVSPQRLLLIQRTQ